MNKKEQIHLYAFESQNCFEQSQWAEKMIQLLVLLKYPQQPKDKIEAKYPGEHINFPE